MTPVPDDVLTAGVDVGSSSVKVAVLAHRGDGPPRVLAKLVERIRRRDSRTVATGLFEQGLAQAGVARNAAAVAALKQLVKENYGERTLNISPDSIYTGALGAALFAFRDAQHGVLQESAP